MGDLKLCGRTAALRKGARSTSKQCDTAAADLNAGATRGIINGARLKELRPAMVYQNTAANLLLLAEIARANWSKLEGKTDLTLDELRQMEAPAARLIDVSNQPDRVGTLMDEPGRDYAPGSAISRRPQRAERLNEPPQPARFSWRSTA